MDWTGFLAQFIISNWSKLGARCHYEAKLAWNHYQSSLKE